MTTCCFLLLDPNRQSAQYTADLIRYFRFEVESVHNLDGALMRLEEHEYSALILDGRMVASASGRLLGWLRDRGRRLPIILVFQEMCESLHQFTDVIDCGLVVHILRKPFPPLALKEALHSAIRQSESGVARNLSFPADAVKAAEPERAEQERSNGRPSFCRNHFAALSVGGNMGIGELRKYMI